MEIRIQMWSRINRCAELTVDCQPLAISQQSTDDGRQQVVLRWSLASKYGAELIGVQSGPWTVSR